MSVIAEQEPMEINEEGDFASGKLATGYTSAPLVEVTLLTQKDGSLCMEFGSYGSQTSIQLSREGAAEFLTALLKISAPK